MSREVTEATQLSSLVMIAVISIFCIRQTWPSYRCIEGLCGKERLHSSLICLIDLTSPPPGSLDLRHYRLGCHTLHLQAVMEGSLFGIQQVAAQTI
jgi:hypothetical protein